MIRIYFAFNDLFSIDHPEWYPCFFVGTSVFVFCNRLLSRVFLFHLICFYCFPCGPSHQVSVFFKTGDFFLVLQCRLHLFLEEAKVVLSRNKSNICFSISTPLHADGHFESIKVASFSFCCIFGRAMVVIARLCATFFWLASFAFASLSPPELRFPQKIIHFDRK